MIAFEYQLVEYGILAYMLNKWDNVLKSVTELRYQTAKAILSSGCKTKFKWMFFYLEEAKWFSKDTIQHVNQRNERKMLA